MVGNAQHGYPILTSDLTIEYPAHGPSPAFVAVRGLDLRVQPGEVLGLLGESGSGKSTIARVLAGQFLEAARGDVHPVITGGDAEVFGESLRRLRRRDADRLMFEVGYVAQDASENLPPNFTVAEIVAEPILLRDRHYNRKALEARVVTMVDAVRLPLSVIPRYPYELSAGQRQRLAIARALVLDPALLIADEPTAAIDALVRHSIIDLIRELQKHSAFSALVISHDLAVLRRIADRIAVLKDGVLVGYGSIDDVLANPLHPYVERLASELVGPSGVGEQD
ncbi:dipeptide/oligopeptide/nickel ABC transporter ATP-binding protein [Leifsonia sp. YIM 134122]|uniref:Dipeptide/oligopeptide/nickel ABC transporter ATP-binding protein n=1 Tax=Leifsonia stereocauli TaxID=3134136 RepID=A0ABU9W185_9MICO